MIRIVIAVVLSLLATSLQAESLALTGARIHTLGALGDIESGTVLIEDGVITAIGAAVDVPDGVEIVSLQGKVITPGLFDPVSYLGIEEISLVEESVDGRQRGTRYTAAFDVAPAINPRSTLIPINRIEGVTRTLVAPAPAYEGASLISGLGAVIHLGSAEDYLVKPQAALFAHIGEAGARLTQGSRVTAMLALREALEDARDFDRNRNAYEERRRRDYGLSRYDLEAMQAVLDRDIPLVVQANRASDIEQLLGMAMDERIEVIVYGGAESWMVADELAAADVAVIIDPTRNLPGAFETLNASLETATRLHDAGVTVAFSLSDSHNARNIRQLAGNAVAHGLPWHQALRAITVVPAGLYGDTDSGALEVGKRAELVVWSGDPLEVTTAAERVLIDGRQIPMRSRQTLLRDRYLELDPELPHAYSKP